MGRCYLCERTGKLEGFFVPVPRTKDELLLCKNATACLERDRRARFGFKEVK